MLDACSIYASRGHQTRIQLCGMEGFHGLGGLIRQFQEILLREFAWSEIGCTLFVSRVARLLLTSPFPSLRPRLRSGVFRFGAFATRFALVIEPPKRPAAAATATRLSARNLLRNLLALVIEPPRIAEAAATAQVTTRRSVRTSTSQPHSAPRLPFGSSSVVVSAPPQRGQREDPHCE